MGKNEIKSFRTKIPLDRYLAHTNIETKELILGDIKLKAFNKLLRSTSEKTIIGTFIDGSGNIKCILTDKWDIQIHKTSEIFIIAEVVLKEQIKDSKYVEQLSLFEDVKTGKDSNNE